MSASSNISLVTGAIIGAMAAVMLVYLGLTSAGSSLVAISLGGLFGACFARLTSARSTSPGAGSFRTPFWRQITAVSGLITGCKARAALAASHNFTQPDTASAGPNASGYLLAH